ncbi:MAG: hypothetical protein IMW98_09625 [Firmicutes bacterium]|nr:hypothetical protein [Bacillota bacterium]
MQKSAPPKPYEVVGLDLRVGYVSAPSKTIDGPGPLLAVVPIVAVKEDLPSFTVPTMPGATWGWVVNPAVDGQGEAERPHDGELIIPGPLPAGKTVQVAATSLRRDSFPTTITWTSPWDVWDFTVEADAPFADWLMVQASPSSGPLRAGQTVTIKLSLNKTWCDAHPNRCYVSPPPPPQVGKP